jgi:hypothetical protein
MHKIFTTLLFNIVILTIIHAQTFEGIVEMRQTNAEGISSEITWYIKKDKLAFRIQSNASSGILKMRFVPQPKQNTMLMYIGTPQGEVKNEIAAQEISSEIDLQRAEVKEIGTKSSAEMGELTVLLLNTATTSTETEFTKIVDINLAKYSLFIKNDYSVQALLLMNQVGFPINSVTKDKSGRVISKSTVTSVKKTSLPDSFFQ